MGRALPSPWEARPCRGYAGFALCLRRAAFFALRLENKKKSIPLKEGNLRGTGSEGPAPHICSTGSAGGGRRPTTIKCDKCHICASRGNDLKLSGTAQLIIILALLLLAGQISISSLSLSWQDLAYLMPRRCIPSPRRSWGVGLLPPRTWPQASKRGLLFFFWEL